MRGLSSNSVAAYRNDLAHLQGFLGTDTPVQNVCAEDIRTCIGKLSKQLTAAKSALRAAGDNLTAFGALKALKAAGYQVPKQVGIAVFDNYPLAAYTDPPLTAVHVDTAMLGEETARLLFQRIERHVTNRQTMLGTSLIIRESSTRM